LSVEEYNNRISIIIKKKEQLVSLMQSVISNENVYMIAPVYLNEEGAELIPTDEIVVQFKKEVSQDTIITYLSRNNLTIIKTKQRNPQYYLLRIPAKSNPITIANKLQQSKLVEWSHPNFIMELLKPQNLPNDTYFNRQFQMHNTGQAINDGRTGTADADVDGPEAWRYSTGTGVIVAVIDEGVDPNNPDLPANRMVNGYDFGDDDNNPAPAGNSAHGTACAGIIGATQNNNMGVTGIAPGCQIMPIKIWADNGSSATVANIANAIDFAWQNGAHVLSNSWGFGTSMHDLYPVITDAIDDANTLGRNGSGSVVVFAAGNTADHQANSNGHVIFPANHEASFTVGSSDRNDEQANYSPTDTELDVVAPSHRAYVCQINTENFEVWTTDISGNAGYNPWHEAGDCFPDVGTELPVGDFDYTGLMGGTSAACPLVAGIAALVINVNPNLTYQQVEDLISNSAEKIDLGNAGYNATGFSNMYGNGRVNAHRAVVPSVRISVSKKSVKKNEAFTVKVTGSAPYGLKEIWWFGEETGIPDIDVAHIQNVPGGVPVYTYEWTNVQINKEGTFKLGSNARDVLYPNPGDGYPHQASEGSGLAYTTIKVPSFGFFSMLITLMLIVGYLWYQNRKKSCIV
jgi:subtilisin family serine protease